MSAVLNPLEPCEYELEGEGLGCVVSCTRIRSGDNIGQIVPPERFETLCRGFSVASRRQRLSRVGLGVFASVSTGREGSGLLSDARCENGGSFRICYC